MSKTLRTAALVVGAVALVATGIGAAAGAGLIGGTITTAAGATVAGFAGVAATTFTAIGTIAGIAGGLLSLAASVTANAKKPSTTTAGSQTSFTASLDQGVPWAIGRTATAGVAVHDITYDANGSTNNGLQTFYGVWSGDRCHALLNTKLDGSEVTFALEPGGSVPDSAQGAYHSWMWHRFQLGASPEATALTATGFQPYTPGWGASSKLSGMAAFAWTLRFDPKGEAFPGGVVPKKLDELEGALAWDPRLDSTYPGGSGPQRPDDESTWAFTENPFLLGLKWARGIWQNGKRVMGIGMALAAIDVPSAVYAANIADANAWKVGGVVYSTDPKWDVMKKICAAGSGEPIKVGGKLYFIVDCPRVSLATVTNDDIIGKPTVPGGTSQKDRINGVIPTYRSRDHGWQLVPATKVVVGDYVVADGRPRTRGLTWELVQDANQVAELATYEICNRREIDGIVMPLKLKWIGYKPGDAITVAASLMAMDNQLIVLRKRNLDPGSGAVTFTARTETSEKHPFALGKTTTPPPTPALATTDRTGLLMPGVDAAWSGIRDDDGKRPENNATNSADPNSAFGNSTVAAIKAAIAEAQANVADIQQTIANLIIEAGDDGTAAEAAKLAAQAARDAAQTAQGAAETARNQSQAARDAAAASATTAASSAGAAATSAAGAASSKTDAATSAAAATSANVAASAARDVAQGAATASAGSASTAAGSATAAGTLASAAQTASTSAATKAGEASTSAAAAAVSETNAAGSANTAGTQATNAATSAGTAGTAATAASGSASTATTKAGEASTSATAAQGYKNEAQVARGDAVSAASTAASSAAVATDKAAAASSYASLAASSAQASQANVTSEATARTSADTAMSQRIDSQDAQLAGTLPSGLKASITNASATAVSAAGAAAQAIQTVEAIRDTRANLQPNGGFEKGAEGITVAAGAGVTDDTYGGRIFYQQATGEAASLMPPINVTPGEQYTVSYEVTVNYSNGGLRIDPSLFDGANASGGVSYDTLSGPGHGDGTSPDTRRSFTITIPAGKNSIQLRIITYGTGASPSRWIRRIKVERGATASPYSADAVTQDTAARVTVAQGASLTALGRLSAFWQVSAVVGGDLAQLSLFADNGAGGYRAGIIIDAPNIFMRGRVIIDGELVTAKFANNSVVKPYCMEQKGGSATGAQVTITIAPEDLPAGSSNVSVKVTGSQNTGSTTHFDIGYINGSNFSDYVGTGYYNDGEGNDIPYSYNGWFTPGNLSSALPPTGGVYSYTALLQLPPGIYTFAMYNHGTSDGGNAGGTLNNIYQQSISVELLKR